MIVIDDVIIRETRTGAKCVGHGPSSPGGTPQCGATSRSLWVTSHNLALRDPTSRVLKLYGQPDSRGPSTKGNQQLELLYYAFDWAGPNVPQVMEVLCTPEKDGQPGKVVEIMLAAASL